MAGSTLPGTLCIRADAHASIGIGHVMRCLALAQAWQDAGGKAVFFCRPLPPALSRRLHDEGFDCHEIQHEAGTPGDILETTSACLQHSAAWLCVDGYQFSPHYRSQLKAAGAKLLVLDDLADSDLSQADAILNQNSYAVAQMYAAHAPNAHLLLGARYVLLRREFLRWRDALRLVPAYAKEVLITLGGSDPTNVTQTVMTLLGGLRSSRLHLKIILGSANPHAEPLLARLPMLREVHDADILVNPPNLPELVSLADVAITAAGSSAWELACLGVPMMVLETVSNQTLVAQWLMEQEMAHVFGPLSFDDGPRFILEFDQLLADANRRQRLSARGKDLIDGQGAHRVVAALLSL